MSSHRHTIFDPCKLKNPKRKHVYAVNLCSVFFSSSLNLMLWSFAHFIYSSSDEFNWCIKLGILKRFKPKTKFYHLNVRWACVCSLHIVVGVFCSTYKFYIFNAKCQIQTHISSEGKNENFTQLLLDILYKMYFWRVYESGMAMVL